MFIRLLFKLQEPLTLRIILQRDLRCLTKERHTDLIQPDIRLNSVLLEHCRKCSIPVEMNEGCAWMMLMLYLDIMTKGHVRTTLLLLSRSFLLMNTSDHTHGCIRARVADGISSHSANRSVHCLVQLLGVRVRRQVLQDNLSLRKKDSYRAIKLIKRWQSRNTVLEPYVTKISPCYKTITDST
jgi:hypothetical protein